MPDETTDLLVALNELWFGEHHRVETCWADDAKIWEVRLFWATDRYTPHQADWAEYTWIFPEDSLEAALAQAVGWCRELDILRPCPICDGTGYYWTAERDKVDCHGCEGSGLEKGPL